MERRVAMPTAAAELDERVLNARAMGVLRRVQSKLDGTDAPPERPPIVFPTQWAEDDDDGEDAFQEEDGAVGLSDSPGVAMQVNRLIMEAQSHPNLCQLYWGWKCVHGISTRAPYLARSLRHLPCLCRPPKGREFESHARSPFW